MLPKNLVLDETATPKNFEALEDLLESTFKTEHEQTTLEALELTPDGTVRTPNGELRLTRDFMEHSMKAIGMPSNYAYSISPELYRENFAQQKRHTTIPVTVCRVGDIATGLVIHKRSRYRPASSLEALRSIEQLKDLELRRASVSYAGIFTEFVKAGSVVEPAVGDIIELGIAISNSEIGDGYLKASAYSHRLVCKNGSVMSDRLGTAHWPNDPRMTPAGCMRSFSMDTSLLLTKVDQISSVYTSVIEKQLSVIEFVNLWRRVSYVLPRGSNPDGVLDVTRAERLELQEIVRGHDVDLPHSSTRWTVYDAHNRITHAAVHGQPLRVRRGLQEVGGDPRAAQGYGRSLHHLIDWDA